MLLLELLEHPRFASGDVDTHFLDSEAGTLRDRLAVAAPTEVHAIAEAISSAAHDGPLPATRLSAEARRAKADDPWSTLRDTRL